MITVSASTPTQSQSTQAVRPMQPTWCQGCGNFGIWGALKLGLKKSGIPAERIVIVYDVGCSGNMADFNEYYGFHALHGRAIPPASGIKLANHNLKVIVIQGDGGGYGEGTTHFINEMRGNHDITLLVHNNQRYSLTTGQMSPTTQKGCATKSTPEGSIEEPFNPIAVALTNHCSFVAREFAGAIPQLAGRIAEAINHPGFSLIDVLQPCAVYNPKMDHLWYQQHMTKLEDEQHSAQDKFAALNQALRTDKLPVGLFWKEVKPTYHQQLAALQDKTLIQKKINQVDINSLLTEYR